MRFLMSPGCDLDIELNAARPGYGKHQANAMNSSSLIYTKTSKRHFTLPQAEDCKGENTYRHAQ
jgi:hypothetical protein